MELFCFEKQSMMLDKTERLTNSTINTYDGAAQTRRHCWIILKGDKLKCCSATIYENIQEANPKWRGFLIACGME